MSESGKNERKKLRWSPEEIRQKQKEDSKNIMVKIFNNLIFNNFLHQWELGTGR